jgi:hypothetical protein
MSDTEFIPLLRLHRDDILTRARGMDVLFDTPKQIEDVVAAIIHKHNKSEALMEVFWDIVTECIEQRNRE